MLLPKHRNELLLRTIVHLKDKTRLYKTMHIRALQELNSNDKKTVDLLGKIR